MECLPIKYLINDREMKAIKSDNCLIYGSIYKFLDQKCKENGSNLKTRIKSFNELTGAKQKPCIYIDDRLFLIPSKSIKQDKSILVNYWMINKVKRLDILESLVIFKDNSQIVIDCDPRVLLKQIDRCALYLSKMI